MKKTIAKYHQGDICLIDFNPTIGDEIKKIRPAIIISGDFAVGLEVRLSLQSSTGKRISKRSGGVSGWNHRNPTGSIRKVLSIVIT
jgi:hypothetical protein